MIRNLLATTALATLVATAAFAQQDPAQPAPATTDMQTTAPATTAGTTTTATAPAAMADGYLATNIIGENVYNGNGDDAQNIGDVNDIVLDKDGKTKSVIVGVGGFLGMGEHNVAVDFSQLSWAEANGDRWLVYPATKEQLQALPEFDRTPYDPAPASVAANDTGVAPATAPADTMAQAPATGDQAAPATTSTDTTTTAAIDKTQLQPIASDKLSADDLIGTTVYGANDENVGEISDIVLSQDGKVDSVIVDVGGFLGIGEKSVAVGFDNLQFMSDKDGNKYLYTSLSKDQLDAQTAYDKGTYADQRDQQRLSVQ